MKSRIILFLSLLCFTTAFSQKKETVKNDIPFYVTDSFKSLVPDAVINSWNTDSGFYLASFTLEKQKGKAKFLSDGTWIYTKYTVPEKELPGPIVTDMQTYYKLYKIKISEFVQEPGAEDHYYLFIRREDVACPPGEFYYSLTGKLIRKVMKEEEKVATPSDNKPDEKPASNVSNTTSTDKVLKAKELPDAIKNYIKQKHKGFSISEAVLKTTEKGNFYHIKLFKKKEGTTVDLIFDSKGRIVIPQKAPKKKPAPKPPVITPATDSIPKTDSPPDTGTN